MSQNDVLKIKDRLGIEEVVGDYIKLEKAGKNLTARCPFHNEKTPSFFVSPDRGTYYCFGCGAKGDIFSFVQEFEGLDFVGALKILAEKSGIELTSHGNLESGKNKKLYEILEKATIFYQKSLQENLNSSKIKKYLTDRGLDKKTILEWRIGYAPNEWNSIENALSGFDQQDLENVGLIKRGDKGNHYDRFRNRIMFPIPDSSGRVIAYSGRILDSDSEEAKYINSPETVLFDKSETLFGFNFAKSSIRSNNFSILVEGQFDTILAHLAGYKNAVASSGTAATERQLNRLKKISSNIVIAYDSDKAGIAAAERAWTIALELGMDVKIAKISEGNDPADLILKDLKEGTEDWKKSIKESENIIDYLINKIKQKYSDPRKQILALSSEILPYLKMMQKETEKSFFIKKLSDTFGIDQESLRHDLSKIENKNNSKNNENQIYETIDSKQENSLATEKHLMGIYFLANQKENKEVTEKIERELDGYFSKMLDEFKPIAEELIFSIETFYKDEKELRKNIDELITNVLLKNLKNERNQLKIKMKEAESLKDQESAEKLLVEHQKISQKINDII